MNKNYFEETFKSPFGKATKEEALKVLDAIRDAHPASSGWEELYGDVEQINGLWFAVRKHRKIA